MDLICQHTEIQRFLTFLLPALLISLMLLLIMLCTYRRTNAVSGLNAAQAAVGTFLFTN